MKLSKSFKQRMLLEERERKKQNRLPPIPKPKVQKTKKDRLKDRKYLKNMTRKETNLYL